MGTDDPVTSPYIYRGADFYDKAITITVTFDESTRLITDATIARDSGCLWDTILIGTGDDGSPNGSTRKVKVHVGTTNVPHSVFTRFGVDTIEEFLQFQITAGT